MPEYKVAGHTFAGTCDDVCLTPRPDGTPCTMSWGRLSTVTEDDINKEGFAHHAYLANSEYLEIVEERKRRAEVAERMWTQLVGVVAG